jgi:hypothetical protein
MGTATTSTTSSVMWSSGRNQSMPKRIIDMEEQADGALLVTFTDPHLASAIGDALHGACKGDLDFHYQEGEFLLRVSWRR